MFGRADEARHAVYRRKMRDHLHHITLRHWDEAMRTLAAVALKDLLRLGDDSDLNDAIDREVSGEMTPYAARADTARFSKSRR
jgi:hypothetical protein